MIKKTDNYRLTIRASVIICTFNRSRLLRETIQSIQLQNFSPEQYEIIIVDNNSTDDTRDVTETLRAASPVKIKYIFEGKQGLSYARNAGIRNAKGKVLVFTDDDIEAETSWLSNIVSVFDKPDVGAAGGPIRPVWLADKPNWLTERWEGHLTINEFQSAREAGEFKGPEYPWGANMAFRKDVFRTIGLFPKDLGRRGKQLRSNEELELCRRIEQSGKKILFAPDAVIHHKIQNERLTKQWFYHRTYWQGRSDALLDINSKANVYARIRQRASEMMWIETDKNIVDFDKKCLRRSTVGYLHQLMVIGKEKDIAQNFSKLRTLVTFLTGICITVSSMANNRDSKIDELVSFIDEKLEDLKKFTVLVDRKDEQISGLDAELKNRSLEIFRRDELIGQKDEEMRQKELEFGETLRNKDNDLKQYNVLISQKDENLRSAHGQLIESNEQLRLKDESLRSAHGQLIESNEQLRLKDESLRSAHGQLIESNEQLRLKDENLRSAHGQLIESNEQLRLKDESLRLAHGQLIESNEQLRLKDESLRLAHGQLIESNEQLRLKDENLQLAQEQLLVSKEQLRLNDESLRSAHGQLIESNEQLRLKDESLRSAHDQLIESNEQLRLKDENLQLAQEQLLVSNEQLRLKDESLQLAHGQLIESSEQLRLKDESLRLTQGQLLERNEQLSLKDESLRLAHGQLIESNEQLRLKDESLRLAHGQLIESSEQLRLKDESLRLTHGQLIESNEQLRLKDESLRLTQEQLLESNEQSRLKDDQINQKDQWITNLINSRSWKITSPLRAAAGLFKKRNGT